MNSTKNSELMISQKKFWTHEFDEYDVLCKFVIKSETKFLYFIVFYSPLFSSSMGDDSGATHEQ